jgi:hypothetical protein
MSAANHRPHFADPDPVLISKHYYLKFLANKPKYKFTVQNEAKPNTNHRLDTISTKSKIHHKRREGK